MTTNPTPQVKFVIKGFANNEQAAKLLEKAKELGIEVESNIYYDFQESVLELPDEEIEGFYENVCEWARHFGSGNGDLAMEVAVSESSNSNNPRTWATETYSDMKERFDDKFEVSEFILTIANHVLGEIKDNEN